MNIQTICMLRLWFTFYCDNMKRVIGTVRTLLGTLVVQKYPLGTKHVLTSLINTTILSNFLTGVHRNVFTVDKVVLLRIQTCFLKIKGIIVVILWWILFLEWRTKYYVFTSETTPSLTVEVLNKETPLCRYIMLNMLYHPKYHVKRYFEITKLVLLGGIYVNLIKNGDLSNVTFCKT